jgi:hypothetical protein
VYAYMYADGRMTVYVCQRMWAYRYLCVRVYESMRMHGCLHTHGYSCMPVYPCMYAHVYMRMHAFMCMYICACMHACAYYGYVDMLVLVLLCLQCLCVYVV